MAGINRGGESLAEDNGRGGGRQSLVQEVDQNADKSARCTRASAQQSPEQSGHVSPDREEGKLAFDPLAVSVTNRVGMQSVSDMHTLFIPSSRV